MPIFEYRCQVCETEFEHYVRSIGLVGEVSCPSCGNKDVKKAWSVFGVGARSGYDVSAHESGASCSPGGT